MQIKIKSLKIVVFLLFLNNLLAQNFTRKDSLQGGFSFERMCFDVQKYDLDITVNPDKKFISGSNSISFKMLKESKVVVNNSIKTQSKQLLNKEDTVSTINQSKENNAVVNVESNNSESISKNRYISAEKLLAEISNNKVEKTSSNVSAERYKSGIAVNANSLLINAESELNQSFRETAIERINKNYNSIKAVLANRNYQE